MCFIYTNTAIVSNISDCIRPERFLYAEVPELSSKEEYEERIVELHSVIAELSR